jgi:hypothetical protein
MPALPNKRHEAFAQARAQGFGYGKAYELAGYPANLGNAYTLGHKPNILKRIEELRKRSQINLALSIDYLSEKYLEIFEAAREDRKYSAAVAALDSVAKIQGFVIDKRETGAPGDFARLSDDELIAFIEQNIKMLPLTIEGHVIQESEISKPIHPPNNIKNKRMSGSARVRDAFHKINVVRGREASGANSSASAERNSRRTPGG